MTLQSSSSHGDHCPLGALDLFKLWRADPHLETVVPFQGTSTTGPVKAQFLAQASQLPQPNTMQPWVPRLLWVQAWDSSPGQCASAEYSRLSIYVPNQCFFCVA